MKSRLVLGLYQKSLLPFRAVNCGNQSAMRCFNKVDKICFLCYPSMQ